MTNHINSQRVIHGCESCDGEPECTCRPSIAQPMTWLPSDEQVIAAARVASPTPITDEQVATHLPTWRMFAAALPAPSAAALELHPETCDLVAQFSRALAEKLAAAEKKYGYSNGWKRADWMDECRAKLLEHVAKGDPRDVAAYCAFLWHHGEKTGTARELDPEVFLDEGLADVQDESGINNYYSKAAVLEHIAAALASSPSSAPAESGWQWVPKEPTEAMVKAGNKKTWPLPSQDVYREMLAAAPQAVQAGGEGGNV
ncbi:hypothetical protein EJP67_18410 [Variovorax guangxiensis]|uniref:Uncharacterized protein n=1 Tax=Variovorax guangxiensis TaxID=1775474 RepID=A0A3S0XAZ1_9BURK|nr:hypothetical protein [Variovorax guangxiensis]RUR69034.1 hypothetical protein EJP67_18410 [Variovorax guangxiensis]